MLEAIIILITIILSPVILISALISFFIMVGIVYSIISIPIGLVKQVIKCQKQEDQKNIQK